MAAAPKKDTAETPANTEPDPRPLPVAWQPFSPRGIAAFALASTARLLIVQLLVALIAAATTCLFLRSAWFPVVAEAIRQLPAKGDLVDGSLQISNTVPLTLASSRFLTIVLDPDHSGQFGLTSDLQVELGRTNLYLSAVLGLVPIEYPTEGVAAFNRTELVPWWGAWSQAVLGIAAALTVLSLIGLWAILAMAYTIPARIMAYLLDRDTGWTGIWRLAAAGLMPGAILMALAIMLYSLGLLDLVQLGFFSLFHLVVGWVFIFMSVLCLPHAKAATDPTTNPFDATTVTEPIPKKQSSANPFKDGQ
jgi:hypothetical protein